MTRDEILEIMREIISEKLKKDKSEIKESSTFKDDLNVYSLDIVDLIVAFEDRFNIEIPDADAEKFVTIGDALDYLVKKTS